MINHQYLAADVILELVALLMALKDQYIYHGEIFCFKFWIFPAIDSHLALPADSCKPQHMTFPMSMS